MHRLLLYKNYKVLEAFVSSMTGALLCQIIIQFYCLCCWFLVHFNNSADE